MTKVAIVGVGGMGATHYNLYRDMKDVELTALVDVEPDRVTERAAACGARAYTDMADMLERETPDIVDICTPSYLHCEQSLAAMEKGCHVITEKPAGLHREDVTRMFRCAEEHHVFFMVAQVLRFFPEYHWLKNAIASRELGQLLHMNMYRTGCGPVSCWNGWMFDKEKSGLVPYDLHIHDIDFAVYALGKPDDVRTYELLGSAGHYVETALTYGGARVNAKAAWYNGNAPFQMGFDALFEGGYAELANDKLTLYPNGAGPVDLSSTPVTGGSEINVANTSGYHNELRYFIECVRAGTAPEVTKEDELTAVIDILNLY